MEELWFSSLAVWLLGSLAVWQLGSLKVAASELVAV
jgi:hypothetical protein